MAKKTNKAQREVGEARVAEQKAWEEWQEAKKALDELQALLSKSKAVAESQYSFGKAKQNAEENVAYCEARLPQREEAERKARANAELATKQREEAEATETKATKNEEETQMATQTTETKATAETTETKKTTKKATKKSETKNEQTNKEEREMATTTNRAMGTRANRVVVRTEADGYVAEFFKTHKPIAVVDSTETNWTRNKDHNPTQAREDFRTWVQAHASEFGVAWQPELQEQAWDRHYWKYETDEQVEEDAITLMAWTIRSICGKVGLDVEVGKITLDSIVPMTSPLSYVEHGKYTKNGNWAVAQVNLDVTATIEGTEINIIYPIEMRSGQLTKIKLTKEEIKAMVEDSKVA